MGKRRPEEPSATEGTNEAVDVEAQAEPVPGAQPEVAQAPSDEHVPDEMEADLLAARAEAEEYKDQWLRAAAELENFRRRAAREFAEQSTRASERVLKQLLEPVDNLERAIRAAQAANEGGDGEPCDAPTGLLKGIEMVYGQCMALLERENVRPIESVGKPFDASIHDALMLVERTDEPPNTVVEEVQRGYWLGDRVLRHAKVVVSKAPAEQNPVSPADALQSEGDGDTTKVSGPT